MNKLCFVLAMAALSSAHAASDPFAPQQTPPMLDQRSSAALLFAATERQAALADSLHSDGARRYAAFAGAPRLRFGLAPQPGALPDLDPLAPLLNERRQRYLSSAEFEQKVGRGTGIVRVGLLRESGGAPGMQQSMSTMLNTRPTTRFTSLSLGYALSPQSSLMAMASYGKTDGIGSPDSLLAQVSTVRTLSYSAGYVRRQVFADNDRLALTWSMPAKVRSGTLAASGAAPLALEGAALGGAALAASRLNLRPTATEHDLEFSYSRVYGRDGSKGRLTGAVMWRLHPGHDANARPDLLMGVRYAYGF